ncbi:hypothetical protein, partial [Nocardia gipuzkoensis]|uniref:hypothetical protein n=1 Tax=Nocardia gipuzkoensis TaxID=2749991 RepID=UPI002457B0E3
MLVAVVAAVIDAVVLGLSGVFAVAPWQTIAAVAGVGAREKRVGMAPPTAEFAAVSDRYREGNNASRTHPYLHSRRVRCDRSESKAYGLRDS